MMNASCFKERLKTVGELKNEVAKLIFSFCDDNNISILLEDIYKNEAII